LALDAVAFEQWACYYLGCARALSVEAATPTIPA